MKAILVVDLGNADSDFYFIDYVVRNKETGNALESGYNVNLKPMPEKVETPKIIQVQIDGWHKLAGEYIGYNACIDEILGAENEI